MSTPITDATIHRFIRDHFERQQRLAKQAERDGVRIVLVHKAIEQHLAVHPKMPIASPVTADGCSCHEYGLWGACGHHALLLSELGQLHDPDEIGWPGETQQPVPIWERRSTASASVVALRMAGGLRVSANCRIW